MSGGGAAPGRAENSQPVGSRRGARRRFAPTRSVRAKLLAAVTVVAAFCAALVLWAGPEPGSGNAFDRLTGPAPSVPSPSVGTGSVASGVGGPGRNASSPTAAGRSDILPGLPFATSSDVATLPPGIYTVTIIGTSDRPIAAVGYTLRGGTGKKIYNVRSPFSITRRVSGTQPYAAIGVEVAPDGTRGSCSISVNGKVMVHHEVHQGYAVAVCVA